MKLKTMLKIFISILIIGIIVFLYLSSSKYKNIVNKQQTVITQHAIKIRDYMVMENNYEELNFNFQLIASVNPLINLMTPDEIAELLKEIPHGNPHETKFEITAGFGISIGMHGKLRDDHQGTDSIPINSEKLEWGITGFSDGIVETFGHNDVFGKFIIVRHSERVRTFYGHLDKIYWSGTTGRIVTSDTVIGEMGKTGMVYSRWKNGGAHLHFEIQVWDGFHWVSVNPEPFLINE